MIALFGFLALALGVSFLCSILEAALLSMPPSFVRQQERTGTKVGRRLGEQKRNIDRSLAAILTLNTIAHTIGAAGVGSQAVAVFGEAYFGLISAVLTLLILVLSEIIPKTLGAQHWRSLAAFTAFTVRFVVIGTYPLVVLSKLITQWLQTRKTYEKSVSRSEIVALAQIGHKEGVLEENESRIIRCLIRFRELRVKEVMTPRTVVAALEQTLTCQEAARRADAISFTRIPLYEENRDKIGGYVLKGDIYKKLAENEPEASLGALKRPIKIVSGIDRLSSLFDDLIREKEQIAVVVDEYGSTIGLVTMEDIIESLIGLEIVDESDPEADMRAAARRKALAGGERSQGEA